MTRRTPSRHTVKRHTRRGKTVKSYQRGRGATRNRRRKIVGKPNKESWLDKFLEGVSEYRKRERVTMRRWFKTKEDAAESADKWAIDGETWTIEKTNRKLAYPWETVRIDKDGKKYYSGGERND